jgi:hypothetical protein
MSQLSRVPSSNTTISNGREEGKTQTGRDLFCRRSGKARRTWPATRTTVRRKNWYCLAVLMIAVLAASRAVPGMQSSVTTLSASERAGIYGGCTVTSTSPNFCIQTNNTCTDSRISANCTINRTQGLCQKCEMTVPNWKSCKAQMGMGLMCGECFDGSSPFCGTVYQGTPEMDGSCPEKDCPPPAMNPTACGQQIPTVSGVPCP